MATKKKLEELNKGESRIWMTEVQAAEYLQCSEANLRYLRNKPRILKNGLVVDKPPVYKFLGNYRYERHELDEWLLKQRVQ